MTSFFPLYRLSRNAFISFELGQSAMTFVGRHITSAYVRIKKHFCSLLATCPHTEVVSRIEFFGQFKKVL